MAVTYQIYGDARVAAGDTKRAESFYQQSISIGEDLVGADRERAEARNNLARAYAGMARLLIHTRRRAEATEYFNKAQDLYGQSLRDDPQNARLGRESSELRKFDGSATEIR